MTIRRWLAGAAMLAVAALPAASGVLAGALGPDNTQAKLASDPDDGGQVHLVALAGGAAQGHRLLPMGGDPPVITHVSRVVLTVFHGAVARPGYIPCPCSMPVCQSGCLTLAGDPDDGGQITLAAVVAPADPPTVRD